MAPTVPSVSPVNKAELIAALAVHFDGSKAEAGRALNAVVETIVHETARTGKVSITGFGVFEKVRRPARTVRNPRTGERKEAPAADVPRFRAGADLKAYVGGEKKVPGRPTAAAKQASAAAPKKAVAASAKTVTVPAKKAAALKKEAPKKEAPKKAAAAKRPAGRKPAAKKS